MNWLEILGNGVTFDDGTGHHAIATMNPNQARNLLVALDRQSAGLVLAVTEQIVNTPCTEHDAPWIPRDALAHKRMINNPRAWLATTPLVGALTEHATPAIGPPARVIA